MDEHLSWEYLYDFTGACFYVFYVFDVNGGIRDFVTETRRASLMYFRNPVFSEEDKKDLKLWKLKNATFNRHTNTAPQGVSLAMDSRLEQGVELRAELRLKVGICF